MKQIKVTVSEDGKITLETSGFAGKECTKEAESIRNALGETTDVKATPEMYERTVRNKAKH